MALVGGREDVKPVPWFSPAEWYQVYEQIYSNDTTQQTEAYEALLAWKARMPKLPVGVDCTLSILQVCLRDREWTPKIDKAELPMHYENDLCLMYSTAIMRFLNHISNIGQTKQTSLFQIAKQINIPEWIVNLRHDAAHGYELPSIGVLRIAINMLLTWLHEEYWAPEAKRMQEYYTKEGESVETNEIEDSEAFIDLIELWVAIGLYIQAEYHLVESIPDKQLQETLQDLREYTMKLSQQNNKEQENDEDDSEYTRELQNIKIKKKYTLTTARTILLDEISRYLGKNKQIENKEEIVLNGLLENEVFLPSEDVILIFNRNCVQSQCERTQLPLEILKFWQDIIILLQNTNMLEPLILKLIILTGIEEEPEYKRHMAALWVACLLRSFIKLNIAHKVLRSVEYKLRNSTDNFSVKTLSLKVIEEVHASNPDLQNVTTLNISNTVPRTLTDIQFVSAVISNANMFTQIFMSFLLELVIPKIDIDKKSHLLKLLEIYTQKDHKDKSKNKKDEEMIYTIEDISKIYAEWNKNIEETKGSKNKENNFILADKVIRNTHWKLAHAEEYWAECPIGILPWQIDSLQYLKPIKIIPTNYNVSMIESGVAPGIIDKVNLKMQSQIKWDKVLRLRKKLKKKHNKHSGDAIMYKALEIIKYKK